MPTIITGIRRRKPFVGAPLRAATAVSSRPAPRPIVAAHIRRPFPGRGTVGRPAKSVAQSVTKRPPAVLVAAPRRAVPFAGRAVVGRPTRAATVAPAKRPPAVRVARPPRATPFPGRGLVLRAPGRSVAPAVRRPLPALVARVAFARPFVARTGVLRLPARFVAPPDPGVEIPGGAFRRARPTWDRSLERAPSTWPRTWRYRPMPLATEGLALVAAESDDRDYAFDLSKCPELRAGATIVSGVIVGGLGLAIGAVSVLAADFDEIPAGEGLAVRISGGTGGTTYKLACKATLSTGRVVTIPGRLVKLPDYST